MVVGASQIFQFFRQKAWFLGNNMDKSGSSRTEVFCKKGFLKIPQTVHKFFKI